MRKLPEKLTMRSSEATQSPHIDQSGGENATPRSKQSSVSLEKPTHSLYIPSLPQTRMLVPFSRLTFVHFCISVQVKGTRRKLENKLRR